MNLFCCRSNIKLWQNAKKRKQRDEQKILGEQKGVQSFKR